MLRAMVLASVAFGCATLPVEKQIHDGPALKVDAVAVYPLAFRWAEPAYRSFELSQDALVRTLLPSERFAVFGPGEFKIYRAADDNPIATTDLASVLADHGLAPTNLLVLAPWVEKRVQSDTKALFDARDKQVGERRTELVTMILHVDVRHGSAKQPLGEVWAKFELDPFAEHEDADPTPELTLALRRLFDVALTELDARGRIATQRVHRAAGFEYQWIPRDVFDYEEPARESLEKRLATADALTSESTRLSRMKFFAPGHKDRTLSTMAKLPAGLWVTAVDRTDDGLVPGDVILDVAGERALPQVLLRRLRAAALGSTVPLQVRRGGERVAVNLPVRD